MSSERTVAVIHDAEFNHKVIVYWQVVYSFVLLCTLVGVVLIPFIWLFGQGIGRRILDAQECKLTTEALEFRAGILFKREATVPLDKITDLGLRQGPVMRYFGITALAIETAGQSTAGARLQVMGVNDPRAFREMVLDQKDIFRRQAQGPSSGGASPAAESSTSTEQIALLTEIRDALRRIEAQGRPE